MTSTIPIATAHAIDSNTMDSRVPIIEALPFTPYTICDIEDFPRVTVYGCDFRRSLKDMADTVTHLELWQWFHERPPSDTGYMYWGHENVSKISDGLENNDHSGATFGYCMRQMQAIAAKGFNTWKEDWDTAIANET